MVIKMENVETIKNETVIEKKENITKIFYHRKLIYNSFSWFLCSLLLIPCYMHTDIVWMLVIIPFTLIIGTGFFVEGLNNRIILTKNLLRSISFAGFRKAEKEIELIKIRKVILNITFEGKKQIIDSMKIIHKCGDVIELPVIDKKEEFKENLKKYQPDLQIEEIVSGGEKTKK
jgi:hypothetical protein